jgi:hypothetical protein
VTPDHTDTMTAEELERFCARQLNPENKPKWWDRAVEIQNGPLSEKQLRREGRRLGRVRRAKGRKAK